MILRYFPFKKLVDFEPTAGKFKIFLKSDSSDDVAHRTYGHCDFIGNEILALYCRDNSLYFALGSKSFIINDDAETQLKHGEQQNSFSLLIQNNSVLNLIYDKPIIDPPLSKDPTPFIEEEDFDFCLFVHNVVNDKARRLRYTERNS